MKKREARGAETRDALSAGDGWRESTPCDFAPVGYATFDEDGTVLRANGTLSELLGIARKRVVGRPFLEFVEPGDHEAFLRHLANVREPERNSWCEIGIRSAGHGHFVRLRSVPAGPGLESPGLESPRPAGGEWCHTAIIDVAELTNVERQLRRGEENPLSLVENSPDAIVRLDREGRHLYINAVAERLWGIPREAMIGKTFHDLGMSGEEGRVWRRRLERVFRGEGKLVAEHAGESPDGRRHFQCHMTPEYGPDGSVETVLVVSREITSWKNTEESLRRSRDELLSMTKKRATELGDMYGELHHEREMLKTIIDRIPIMIVVYDTAGQVRLVNREFERVIGWTKEELRSMDVMATCYPDEAYRREIWSVMMEPRQVWRDVSLRVRDGGTLESSWAAVQLSDGTRVGIGIDGTGRKASEDTLRRQEMLLSTVLDTLPVGVYVLNEQGTIIRANPAGKRIWGEERTNVERFGGYQAWRTETGEQVECYDGLAKSALRDGTTTLGEELAIECFDGTRKIVMNSVIPLRDEHAGTIGAIVVNEDISVRKRVETDLARYRERLEDLVEERTAELVDANRRLEREIAERKQIEKHLRESEEKFRLVLKNAPLSLVIQDRERRHLWMHDAQREPGEKDFFGKRDEDLFPPDEAAALIEIKERVMATGRGERVELPLTVYKGSRAVLDVTVEPLRNDAGEIIGVSSINLDITERKRAEDALRQNEQLLSTVLDNLPVGVWISDKNAKTTRSNPAARRIWGGANEMGPGVVAKNTGWWVDSGLPLEREDWASWRAAVKGEVTLHDEIEIECVDGTHKVIRNSGAPLRNARGKIVGGVTVNEDITERKRAEEALRSSEERFRSLLLHIQNVAVQGYNPDGTVHYWNDASEALYGYRREEAVGKNILDIIIPPEMREEVAADIRHMVETGEPSPAAELMLLRKDGTRVPVYSSHALMRMPGRAPELFCVDIDITGIRQAEAELRASEDRFRILFEKAPIPYYSLNSSGHILEVNHTWLETLGYGYEEVIGHWVGEFVAPESLDSFRSLFAYLKRVGELHGGEYTMQKKNGASIIVSVDGKARYNPDGSFLQSHSIFQDITERRRLEENVVRLRKEQEAILAHEVKNLLIPLHVYVENLLFTADTLDIEQRDFLEKIRMSTDRAFDFANYFTRLYDLEEGTFTLKRTRQSLTDVVRQSVAELELTAERHGVTLRFTGNEQDTELDMDVFLMPGVFFNLILNAIEHVAPLDDPAQKTVTVDITRRGNRITVRVNNRGEPLSRQRLRTFFDKFNADTRKKNGLGLGTTYAYLVVKAHDGEISVTSTKFDGTTVAVTLPVEE